MGFHILGFLTYLGDRLVRFATWDDAITERYLNVRVYVSTTGNLPDPISAVLVSLKKDQESFTTSISLASISCPFAQSEMLEPDSAELFEVCESQ